MKTYVLEDAFTNSKPSIKEKQFIVDRSQTEAGKTILSYCSISEVGVFLLYGSPNIGLSTQIQCTVNKILKNNPKTPILYVSLEHGLKQAAITLNAFPVETTHVVPMPENENIAFEDAIDMLGRKLKSEENVLTQTPILIIDSINQIPDEIFNPLGSKLKYWNDHDLIKVVLVASNCAGRKKVKSHKKLMSRLHGQDKIINDFTFDEVKQVLEHDKTYCNVYQSDNNAFSLIANAIYNVTGGRIGLVKKLCSNSETAANKLSPVHEIINAVKQQDIDSSKLETIMVEYFFNFYIDKIVKAFDELSSNNIDIDKLICADLVHKFIGGRAVQILKYHDIINTLHGPIQFDCEPLKRIFDNPSLRQKIRNRLLKLDSKSK